MVSMSAAVLAGILLPGPATEDAVTVTACRTGDLTVRVWVRRRASLTTPNWLAVEFVNTGREPVEVDWGNYRFEGECDDLPTGRLLQSGGLASGSVSNLFGKHSFAVPPGTHRCVRPPSDYSAALLGLPPQTGWRVRATFHLSLFLRDKRAVKTPEGGVPFTFEWHHPGEVEFAVVRDRLRRLLREPEYGFHHGYLLGTLLKVPEVGGPLTRDELLAALSGRTGPFDGRQDLARLLRERHGKDPVVIEFYRKLLRTDPTQAVFDLDHGGPWDPSFAAPVMNLYQEDPSHYHWAVSVLDWRWDKSHVAPLIDIVASDPGRYWFALEKLAAHRKDWVGDQKKVGRLSAAVRKAAPKLGKDVGRIEQKDLEEWTERVRLWALTGDPAIAQALRPALADRRQAVPPYPLAGNRGMLLPYRVCDFALDAILIALDGPQKVRDEQLRTGPIESEDRKLVDAYREGLIRQLEQRLDRMKADR